VAAQARADLREKTVATIARGYPSELPLQPCDVVQEHGQRPPEHDMSVVLDREVLLRNGVFGFENADPRNRTFVMLRSQVLRQMEEAGHRTLAVTSAQPRNGKSFVATNLAAALSQIHPTCLVDLDLRRPTVHDRLALPDSHGSDDFLLGQDSRTVMRCGIGAAQLMVVPVNEPRASSADILATPRLPLLLERLKQLPGAPICILDTPPVLEGDDMMIIAQHVDQILLVVEEGRTRRSELRECLRLLRPTPLLGTVLNRVISAHKGTSYGQYHGYRP